MSLHTPVFLGIVFGGGEMKLNKIQDLIGGFVCVKTGWFHKYKLIDEITKNTGKAIMWK